MTQTQTPPGFSSGGHQVEKVLRDEVVTCALCGKEADGELRLGLCLLTRRDTAHFVFFIVSDLPLCHACHELFEAVYGKSEQVPNYTGGDWHE